MTSKKTMPTPDDAAFDERLERALPRFLADHPYNFQQDLEDFRDEEASLDAEIDRIWEQVVEEEIPVVIIEKPKPVWPKPWVGILAASLVVGLGVAALMTIDRSTPNASTLRSTQGAGISSLAQALQQQWKPTIASQANRNILLMVKVEAGDPKKVELHLLQSSGDEVADQQAIKTASDAGLYEKSAQKLPATYLLDFDLHTGKVSATQK
jgi:hypothetical protein